MNPQPKPLPRVIDKRAAKREEQSTLRSVYKQVDDRDKRMCRCCGSKERLEHHHLVPRSKGGKHTTANVLLLCGRLCHRLCQTHWIWVEGDDCNKPLVFTMSRKVAEALFSHRAIPAQVKLND